jgi:hypothetical protein
MAKQTFRETIDVMQTIELVIMVESQLSRLITVRKKSLSKWTLTVVWHQAILELMLAMLC